MDKNKIEPIVIYDIKGLPTNWSLPNVIDCMRHQRLVVYDSTLGANAPQIIGEGDLRVVDVKDYQYLYKIVKDRLMTRIKKNFLSLWEKHTHHDINTV